MEPKMSQTLPNRYVPMPRAGERIHAMSRSGLYLLAAAGHITLKKYGKSVLVDADSVLAFVESLPDATIKRSAA